MKILLLAPESNPRTVTGALIGYSLGEALARIHDVTLVVRARDEEAVREANGGFCSIESIPSPRLDRFYDWVFRRLFKGDRGNLLWTAVRYPVPIVFEWQVWRRFRERIRSGDFDVALRILPVIPMMPSAIAFFMRNCRTPFVIGPINGGVPWPKGFSQLTRQKAAAGNWAAGFRGLYRFLPFVRPTYSRAAAIIVGSSHTYAEFLRFRNKMFFVPGENGVRASVIQDRPASRVSGERNLELVFAGRLVPYKACDIALRAAAGLLRARRAHLVILGDGPERARYENLAAELRVRDAVTFCGMVSHSETLARFRSADVLLFPSLREFGGGVVLEALAMGAVPVVADHGGPGDIVRDDVGYRIPVSNEEQMVRDIQGVLERLALDRSLLELLRKNGLAYARNELTWDSKAEKITEVLLWATGRAQRPSLNPPKSADAEAKHEGAR